MPGSQWLEESHSSLWWLVFKNGYFLLKGWLDSNLYSQALLTYMVIKCKQAMIYHVMWVIWGETNYWGCQVKIMNNLKKAILHILVSRHRACIRLQDAPRLHLSSTDWNSLGSVGGRLLHLSKSTLFTHAPEARAAGLQLQALPRITLGEPSMCVHISHESRFWQKKNFLVLGETWERRRTTSDKALGAETNTGLKMLLEADERRHFHYSLEK